MPSYAYQAIDENGAVVSGIVEADSTDMARNQVAARGYIPQAVRLRRSGRALPSNWQELKMRWGRVGPRELILFTKQFSTMTRAAIPILNQLDILEHQTENPRLKAAAHTMLNDIQAGASLRDVFARHPDVFSPLYCSMIHAGEASGSLPEVLDRLIYIIEHENKVKSDVKAALRYPMTVAVLLFAAFLILLTFVVPKFEKVFTRAGLTLPIPTRICIIMYQGLRDYWIPVVVGAILAGVLLIRYLRTDSGRLLRDRVLLRIPLLGPLFIKAAIARFASIFALLQVSGVPVLDSLAILSRTIGNAAISGQFDRIRDQLVEGRGIAGPLSRARYFSPMVINMVAVGEESGNLAEMLREVSSHYDTEVEYATKRLADAVGPILTIGLAAVVGFFALAIYMPMWDLAKMAQ